MSILKLAPACKDYLWGGTKLITDYGKQYTGERLAETWELSCHPDGLSVIAEGPDAGKTLMDYLAAHPEALGKRGQCSAEFPILIKLIDAAEDLSVQVHPDNAYARVHEGQSGKTEMWYILSAEPDSFLYCGFERDVSKEEFARRIADGTLLEILHRVKVKAGDAVFIPAGTIHAIRRGIMVAEVQQSSNVTYRVCDYGRLDADGKPRTLHIAQALDVTRRSSGVPTPDFGGHLACCECFTVDLLTAPQRTVCGEESFLSLLVLNGEGTVACGGETVAVRKGESLFLSAGSGEVRFSGSLRVLAARV
ncbi:MAG: class I mannose-6-phosphate isomerase [Eubacteriales bacterium]|nr:class I mannose-6-phosphate isomerase [Eubacteriales bacterium]